MDGATGGGRGAPPGPGGRGTGNTDETFKLIAQFKSLLHFPPHEFSIFPNHLDTSYFYVYNGHLS